MGSGRPFSGAALPLSCPSQQCLARGWLSDGYRDGPVGFQCLRAQVAEQDGTTLSYPSDSSALAGTVHPSACLSRGFCLPSTRWFYPSLPGPARLLSPSCSGPLHVLSHPSFLRLSHFSHLVRVSAHVSPPPWSSCSIPPTSLRLYSALSLLSVPLTTCRELLCLPAGLSTHLLPWRTSS